MRSEGDDVSGRLNRDAEMHWMRKAWRSGGSFGEHDTWKVVRLGRQIPEDGRPGAPAAHSVLPSASLPPGVRSAAT